jgi:hypothetical protein
LPNEKGEVWLSVFEDKEKGAGDGKQAPKQARRDAAPATAQAEADFSEEIPF